MTPEEFSRLKQNQSSALERSSLRYMRAEPYRAPPKKQRHQVELEKMRTIVAAPGFVRFEGETLIFSMVPRANSLNRAALMGKRARLVKTTPARIWVEAVHRWFSLRRFDKLGGPIEVEIKLFTESIAQDIDAPVKQLLDVLKGRLWHDDAQVVDAVLKKRVAGAPWNPPPGVHIRVFRSVHVDPVTIERLAKSDRANGRPSKRRKR